MNYRDKIQKFSIRKYTVGTFSTVIATLVFLGFNTSQAHAAETNQPASVVKQKQQSNNEQTENRESQVQNSQNSQNGQSLSATHENEQPNINQTNHVDVSAEQSSTTENEQAVSQNKQTKKDTADATPTQSAKAESKHEQNESRSANKKENDNKAAHVENHEANVVTASDSPDNGNVQHDRNELQAFFDANYHDYRFIDRENADSGTFNYVKGIFDKINTLLGSNDPINNKDLQLAYKELEQAVALIRTMPQRQQTSRRSSRIQTRSVESRAAEPRSVSSYQNADSSYYVENANDGSGYPVGTYINASNKGAPFYLPTAPWNTLKASAAKEIVLITAKQTGDGYQWVIKFNKGHAPHENMIFWFALPSDQVPVGRTDFVTVNADGTNVQWSNGAGAGAYKPLPQMWPYGVNDSRSRDFKIRNRSGQVIYDWTDVHVNTLRDLARAGDYFSEAGAPAATKAIGEQTFRYINGERPTESPGASKVYTFIGAGDASYTISFKTQGPTTNKLYYAAGGRALEYNQLFMYSQLYVESTQDHQQRLDGFRQVVNRSYRLDTTKRVEVSQGNIQTKKVLESTNLNIDDFMDDPLSYVKTPSNKVLGFYPTNANPNAYRHGGTNPLNEYQLSQLFTDDKLQQAARTGNPIRLMIGFDYPDGHGNAETLVPVNLTVLPEIQHNIKFYKNDDTQNIADKPASRQAGHPIFYVYAGNQGNASVNLGGSVTSIQPLRINLTSSENFTDRDWQITGIPRTLHIENSTNRPNNARERNIELVGNLLPGDYFGTIRFGRKEQLFEIRVKPHTPTITTTAEQLRGTALQKVPITVTNIPLDPSSLVYIVYPTDQTRDGGSEADQMPSNYSILATGTPDGVHNTITIQPKDYTVFIPPVGKQIRALIYYNKVVASNMSNAVTILPDDIPPTINNPVGLNAKYYRGDEVNFTMGVSDRHSGIKNTTITTLPNGWTSNLTKADKNNGSLSITGRVSMNQAFNSDITFKVSATDNVNNTTNDSQSKHVTVHVGKISEDAHPIVLANSEKVVVVNPTSVSNDEKQRIITAFMNKNQNIRGYLASSNPVTVDNNGNVTLHYRDGSSTTLDATNVMTYEPVVKPEYQTANAPKTATVTIAKGQSFSIGDIKQYFTLSNGQAIPNGTFTNITSDRTIPTAQEVSQMNAGTQLYHIVASNAYHKDTEDLYISLKIIDVKQPEGDQRVYRTSTYDLTTDEISKVKQAFINANRDAITFAEGDISVTNTPNGANVSTVTVNINKGRLTKSFTSNLANMNFLRWVNFPQDYTVSWTNAKIASRPTDGGLSWSDDHKSLIYRYDATLGTPITTNDILTMLKATTTVPGLRNNIAGNEKTQAEAGGRPNYRPTGYSQANASSDGQRQYTLNGQVIQVLDIINPTNGFGGQTITNSNVRANHSNSTVVSVNEPAANGAGAFTIDHVVKNNTTHNAADAVYKAQLYLSPYGPKQYVEHLNQNTGNTTDAINIYFVPSDLVNPTISVGNYANHQVFSGETFTNTITANDNFGVQSVTVPNTSQITGTVDNNHQHVSATAPNVTSATNKTINLVATDTSGNTATTSYNVTIKPLRDKYRVGTSSTAANPVRIANISNNAIVSQADQTAIINSLTFTETVPNRSYARASANEITSKTVSNVSRTGNNANVTVTVTYQDGTTSTVTVPVKHVIPEIVAHSHYTVQGQDFPAGNGSSASDYFKLSNGSAIPDATITWVSGQAPNKDNTRIGEDITVTAHILIDGETTPITKTATYKVVRTVPKHVFETDRGVLYPGVSDMYDAKQYVKPVNNSWSTNAQNMNFQFVGTYGPNKDVVGISTRLIRITYDNRQTEELTILSKVKPDPPRIDGNSVTYKAGLTNQEVKVNNVLSNSTVKLFKADNTPLNVTNIIHGSGYSSVVTVSDALPNGGIKAKSSISMNNVTYTTQDEHGQVVTVTRNESVDSNDSASVTVTPQLQATTEGAVFIKGGDGFDFGHVERFIQNPPHGATVAWHDNPDTWKNTVGNTHKTAVVTLPSGQGTRNVEVPVKVYPVANAKALSRDVKGQNLTNGTDAMSYITFDPNTNTNGITAAWANRQQPNNQQAGVQHLNVDVTYPGISAAKRVPVTVNVYQFEFPQTTYTTTVGGTLASGTQASGYAHMQNATGLPTDGFTYKWNNAATGTNDANWAAMNKPNAAKVVNAKYDVIYNGHTFATSLPAKFVVKDVQPAKPTVTETAAGAITIAPGANQTVNTHAGNVTTYADKLVIKRNGSVVTTFTRHNNTSPWVKEASATNVTGIVGTNNGITVAAGTFNPADTIQVVATQGSGETISDEQRSDDFTVVAPQPNQATTKIWQNGHIDITPNNPSGHLINPTQAMDIAYTEKVGNGAEHSKTINVVRGQNNQWTIANKPDYVTLDAQTGKVTFNANTIKPNSAITITPKAGTGHSASSNPSTLTAPAAHTVNTTEIVKDYGSNVTASEINNAVQVANKRTATIKNGTAMPTNLAGGSTTTIPVTVTYNDGSTEEVQESIFTKADKRELITAKNHLDDPVSTDGKKPGTITQYNNAMHNAQQQINAAKTEAQQVINNERATPQQVNAALSKVQAAQTKINEAKALLQNKEDNSQLVTSKNNLQSSVNQVPSTAGMTQQSIDNYNAKKREAESEITAAQRIIDNGDATAQQISDEKHRVDNALTALNQAKHDLTADTHALEQAVQQLNRTGTTTGKKPASITAYNNSIRALQSDLTSAKNSANAIIQKPIRTVQEVQSALTNVNRVNERLTQAINQLVPLADNSTLRTAKTKLDEEINKSVTTDGMTQSSIQAYENAKRAGQTESTNAQNVINNGDATDQQIAAEKAKVEEKYNSLKQAIAGLTPDLAPLQTAKTQLQNDIDQPTSTTGMTSASVATFNEKLSAARTKIQEINRVLASHPDVATIRQNVTAANAAKSALDQARNGLTVDKAPLENAKNQLQHSIDTQTSTTGMTQDSINAYNAKLTAARNKIQQINQVLAGSPTVDQINTNTSAANQAKSDLDHARQALTPDKTPLQNAKTQLEQSINQPTDTTGMTTASLNAYNQKLQAARQKLTEINQVLNGNPTVQNINDKVAEANQAKDQLNTARQGLTLDRQPALTTLHGASNLNQAQQNNFTQQINAAQNHAALETIKSNITALNTAMTKLKESVADNNSIKSGQNYTDATQANKQAYDNAVNAAKGVIGETNNPTMDVNTVNQKAASVKSTKDALDGQQNLQRAKTEATNAITHASDLNQAQKNALTQQVNSAQNVQAVNNIKQTTQSLNTAMTGLKRGVANHNQVVQSDNYVNADTNKKNDYNNAYNHANDIINGNPQHPVITPSDVNNALSNVTSKEHALNGEAKLNTAKQEANTALGQLNNLNNAQRQNLQSQINGAHQIETVNTIKQNATNLNSAMGNLRHAVADKEQVKRTEDYADADTAKQNAYNSAVSSAETIINQSTNPTMSVDDVNRATSAVTTNKTALNGDEKLAQSKTDAARAIDALPHLNNAQKADVKSKINAASNIAGVNTVKQQGTDLNTAMGNLQGAINDEQTTLNSQNYQDATPSKKTAYTNAVQAAKDILNKSNGQNKTKDQVTEAMNQVNSAKNNLDGTRLLDQAKQTAKQQLNNMTHLTTAQKTNLTNQINSGTTVAGVHTVQSNANTLDQAMNTLRQSIANKDATKASEDYVDANNDKQTAYNNAVAAAKAILNKQTGSNSDKAAVDHALQQVTSTKDALNGDAKLAEAKAAAKQNLGTLNHITNAQRTALEGQINQVTTVDGVNTVKTNANTLDGAMNSLQGSINDKDATLRNQNYLDADESKRNAYTQAVTAAEGILNKQTGGNTSKADVDNALNAVTRAKAALNGADNLRNAKTSATNTINGLPHLTQLQKDNLKHQVEQAQNVAGVNGVKDKGNTLNTAMGALRTSIQNDNTTKTSQNYLDASDSNKNNYNTAVNNANGVINATNNPNMDANAINGMANQVNTTKAALNGAQNLAQAKTNATNTINNAHDLNQKQKDALKTQVNNAQRVSDANNVQRTATELNSAMTALKAAIADKERTKASGNYVNADQEKRQAYDSKVTNAENIISGTPNATLTVNDVNSAASQVNAAKTALNGDNNLRVAKEHANNTIDGLAQLNNAQKAKLKEQVQSATTLDGVQTVKNSSQTLNTAMKGLRDSIANEATIKAGQNYTDASPNNRNEYDSAVTAAKAIINQTSNPTMEPNTITQATSQVTTKEHALNGAQNLAQAKTTAKNNLNNLTSINNAQKDALTRSIDGATTVAGVNQETAKATELNNAMHSLQNGINDETQTKQTQKYLDAEPSKKSAYDQAVNAAKAILTKASGQNVDKAAVEQALQNVNSTKTALNGDAKLNEAKAAAKQTLGTLTHINNAQRTALDNEITQATNVEGVNTVKAKAQQLDGAMGQLETSIRDKDTTLQSQNYQDADDAKRTAYSQAVNAAATILNKTAGGNTPKADVERAMQAVTQANTALNGIQNLERAKQAANTAITNASDLNTKQKEALKAQVTSAGRVSAANGVEHTATELNTAMTALKRAIADKAETKASGNYVNVDANKRQAYDEKVTAAENIVSGTPTPTLTPSDVTNAATQVTNAKTQLNGNHNLEVAKQNANTAIDGLTSLNGPQKAKLKEQVGQATTLPNVQTVRDNAQTLNTAMKGLRESIANEATIKADQNYTDASQSKQTDYNNAVTAAKAIIGQTTSPTMNAQEINQAKDQVTAKQQALNGQENLRTAQTNAKQHLNGLSDLTNAQKEAAKRQIEGATHVNEVTQAQNNADALNTAMTNLKNGIQDQNTIKRGVNFTDADEAKRNAYTNAVTQAEQILNKAQGPNTAKDGVETALQNVQRAKNDLNGNQNVANAKTTAKNALNNLTSINNAQKEALKSQIEGATTVAGVNQVSTTASELNTAMSNLQRGINDEAATKAAQKYTDADREKQTAYNDAVTAAKTLLNKTAGSNDNKAAVEQALQRVNTAKNALNGDARLNEAKKTAKQQLATMSHLTDAQKANLTSQIERGTTVAGVQGIQANAGTLNQAMNQLRQSIASKDATKSSEDYQDANTDLQNAYNRAVSDAEGIISATNNPEMNPDTINQKASQVNSAKSALNGDEKLAAAKQTAKTDIGRLTDLNNAQRTAANAEVDQAPNLAAVTAAKNKATSLNTAMGNLKHALAEKDNTKRSVNYTDADRPKQQAYDTAVTQAEAITNANGSNANETQVQAALNQLNQAKNDLNGDNKVAQAKEAAKRALASYNNLNNAQSIAATSQIDNATTVAGVTAAQNTANELNTAMGQLQNSINDQNTVKQQVNFTDADQGKKDAYTNAVTNAQGILDKAHGQNMTKAQVEAALNQVTTAKNALNGDANVRQAKSDAKANLGTLTHLNNAQKQDLTSQIEGATTVNGVNGVKTKAQDLDGAMQRLESAIANKDQTRASENYIDADPTKKTAFDNAITQAESYLNKDHGANKDKQAVEQAIQSVTTAKNALNGDANLQRAKTEATQAIDNLTHLNTPQKTALKQQVNAAQRVSGVTDLKNSATSLNNAMDQLKQAIADHDTIVAGGNYTNASPDKQGAYTDAYNAAKNIVNGSPNVVTNAADVTAATQRVNNAETGLNGDSNLATAKQQAKDALRQMTHLSAAQKQSITGQIDSATQVTGVQSVKDNATNLDNAMNQLRNSIANKDEVKASQPYVDADTDKQNAYNTAVTSAENIINATSQPTLDPSAVTQAANQVNTNKTALNGVQNLANKKQETTANINQLSHLNNAQKQDLNTQVTNAPNISTVNQVKTKAEQLDQAMERLINGIQDKDQVKQSVNFTDADPEKQTAYNNAVTAAENIINQANGTNANQSQVEAALSTVTTTKQALNGNRKVTDAKNNANQTLSTLDNLNNAQKGAVTGNINQAHTVAEVTQAIQTAQELNTAMGNLKNSLNDKDTTLGSQNFADADPEKKNAYNEAVHNAENILNKSTGTNVPKDQVEAAMNQVNTTKAALNGTQNLEKAKQHANTAIDGLSHLTNAQKDALKQLVQQSTTVAEAQGNEQKANNVDAAMDKLRQSIADNATTKQNQNYTDASPNKKDAYNNAVTTAQGIIDQTTSPTLDPTVINQAAGQVSTTKNALNGNENLEAAKQQATQSLGSLDNLNNAQKQTVTDQINGAHTVDEANQIKQNAQNLNTAMGNLKQAIADKDATKATVNFTDADQAKQQAYNTAVTNAENIISKANGGNATQTEVEQAIQQVNAAKQALNGNANVQHAKDEATALINSSNDLNQAQKDALKQQVQNATTVAGVNNVKQTAQELNNAMTQLKQGIADKEQTKADGNFVNADPDKQNAYNQAVAKAEALISGTPDVVVTPSEITAALNKVTQAKNDLNGNTNLATAKQNVQQAIDQLPNLNQAQRDEYNKQITQATLVPNVNAIQQAATTLNDAMTQLKQGIANKAQIKGSENYHDADTDKQTAYDNAVTKAEELLKQTTNPTMDPNTIQQALTKVNDTNQALNGNQKLADAKQAAKTNLGTLDHLNDAQKQALTTQVEQAPDIATVNNVKQNAQNLNNAMTNLNNALQDKTETLNSINFTDADQAKKDAYTNAVAHAEGILSKANGSNASQTEVEQAIQRVNEAKQALNGNDNVQRAKDAAKQVITNANDLNQAQKDALKQQVDAAQTVANVNTIKQTAQDLNQAMTQLKQGIADKDQTKANGNFVNADTDKQNAYNNAVAHAEQIISGTPNANVDPQQVAQALQQVTQAKGDLNGNHNLQVAKDNANTAIDQLPNLNQPQKTALKDQVSHAELVTGVNAIKQNADALNNAMGTLKQQIQANSQVPQSVDFTQADQDKQQAYNNAANQAQQIANGTPTPVLSPDTVTQAVTTMNQAKDALNGDEKLAQAKQDALANLDTLRDLNQPQRDALRNQINQAQALATVEQTKQNAQNVNATMGNLKQGIANKDTVKASENYHDADADKQTAYTNAVSQAEGIINQTTNPTLNPDEITRALTQVTDAKNGLNGEAKLATEKQNAKDAVSGMTHLNDAQKQALKGQIDQSPEIATVNQVKQTATSLDHAMDQLSQAINDKAQTLADGNYLNADPDKQNAYKQAVAKAEALLNKQSGTNEVQAQVESITNEVKTAKQALNGNDNLANAKQQAKQQLANLTHLNDAQKQSFENQITQAPLVTDVTTINQKAQTLDHAMELLRNSIADNQATLASEDYHDATAQRQNDYNQAVTAANNIINQTTSPTMNPDDVNRATTQVNNTKVALDGDENLVAAKQQANNRLDQLDHLNNAQKQQLQSQITQSSDIAAVNGHKQTAESLNTAMGNLINAIADHQAVEQRGNFINADTDKQTAYTTAVNEAEAMINKQTGQNANQTEVEQAITKVQTTLQALNGDHNLQVAKTNATQAIDALTSLNDPQKTALKDQVTAATLVTAVHQIEQTANTLNQAMHGLRESIQDNATTQANSKYINEDQPEQQNYDQAVQAANNIINEQTATLDNNAINQAATTVNTTKAALHGDVKLQNDKDRAKQTVSQLAHLNNAQKHMEDTLIDSETTRTAVNHDLTEAQALDQLMDTLQQSIADKDATRASSAYVNAEPNKKQAYDEAVQNAESIIAGLTNPTINKGNVSSATQAVTSSKNALDGVERLAQDKQTAGNSLNHLDQLTPAQQQALENQINNATTRDKVAEIIAQAQALNEAMKALKESIKDQPQTEASSKFINEDQAQKDAYTQAVQHAKDLINKTTDPTLAKSIIDQATQAVTDAKNNLHGDQKLAQDKQRATETLNNLSNLNTPQRQALENQINNAATR
ncbi:TPA: hyperosmolarity resistance protein Ebh, partial [Staphylococcus aureus]|nr:hyperosmolarity resistance protein Ebh [Staphylococcus aureus]